MNKISRDRREELRPEEGCSAYVSGVMTADELHSLLNYADQRDEAVALLEECRGPANQILGMTDLPDRIDALLRRVEDT